MRLQKLLGENFKVQSFLKPGAQLKHITSSIKQDVEDFTFRDYVILLGGMNDTNPYDFCTQLNICLNLMSHTNVIISEVPHNRYLREQKLNYEIRYVCEKYPNAMFLNMNYSSVRPTKNTFEINLSRALLKEVLHLKYKHDYINYMESEAVKQQKYYVDKGTQTSEYSFECKISSNVNDTQELSAQTFTDTQFFRV